MASHDGSRKRLKVSRTEDKSASSSGTPTASSSKSVKSMAAQSSTALVVPDHHEQTLKALNTDIEAMRQLCTCKICDRLLYEPYSLSCGHTYCYSCLSQWLVSNRKKTCPDCRTVITQQPTPSYIIRELVLIFVSRSELLPDGETSEEHNNLVREEAKIVADDKANTDPITGGLFKGCFSRGQRRLMPIHDPSDRVDRCPSCHWELEDGICEQCGFVDDEFGDYGTFDDDDEISNGSYDAVFGVDGQEDYFGEDDFDGDNSTIADIDDGEGRSHRSMHTPPHRRRHAGPIDITSTDDESSDGDSEDDRHDPTLRDFIVDDDDQAGVTTSDPGEDTDVPRVVRSRTLGRRRAPVVISDDEDNDAPSTAADHGSIALHSEDSDDDSVPGTNQQRDRRRVPVRSRSISTGSSGEEDMTADDEDDGDHESSIASHGGFSPIDESARDDFSQRSEYDSDHPSSHHAMYDGDGSDEGGSSGSDEEDGWDTRSETPRGASHQQALTLPQRPEGFGQRNNRNVDSQDNYHGFFRGQPTVRSARPNFHNYESYPAPRPAQYAAPHSSGSMRPPVHPFQLGNTLHGINSYNQRNQQIRSNPDLRTASGGSSRSGHGGGVEVYQPRSSGSSRIVRGDTGRRKRALSISSDVSYD